MKKSKILYIIIMILGIAVLSYPFLSSFLKQKNQTDIISTYDDAMQNISDEEMDIMLEEAKDFNNRLSGNSISTSSGKSYMSLLNIGDVIGYVKIPVIDVNLPIYHGTSEEVLQIGVGHIETSSLPVGGPSTHALLTGHRGLPSSTLFTHLDKVKEGDVFYITVLKETLAYEVDQIRTVLPENTSDLQIIDDKDYVTLITCTPYMINSHRLLVRGHRIDYNGELDVETVVERVDEVELPVLDEVGNYIIRANTDQLIIIYFCAVFFVLSAGYIIYYITYIVGKLKECQEAENENVEEQEEISISDNKSVVLAVDEEIIDDFDLDNEDDFALFEKENESVDLEFISLDDEDVKESITSLFDEDEDDYQDVASLYETVYDDGDGDEIVVSTFIGDDEDDEEYEDEEVGLLEETKDGSDSNNLLYMEPVVPETMVASDVSKEETLPFNYEDEEIESVDDYTENTSVVESNDEDLLSEDVSVEEASLETDGNISIVSDCENDVAEEISVVEETVLVSNSSTEVPENKPVNIKKPVVTGNVNKYSPRTNKDNIIDIIYNNKNKIVKAAVISTMVITVIYLLKNKKNKK